MVLKAEEESISYYVGSTITKDALAKKPVMKAPAPKVAPAPAPAPTPAAEAPAAPEAPKEG
jgi:small subunit ribosomal protein S4